MENKKDLDDFWNIDDMIPKKKVVARPVDTSLAEISQKDGALSFPARFGASLGAGFILSLLTLDVLAPDPRK